MKKEYTYKEFENSESFKDLYPYDYKCKEENLKDCLVRLIFKAINHGRKSPSSSINSIEISSETFYRIKLSMKIGEKIYKI